MKAPLLVLPALLLALLLAAAPARAENFDIYQFDTPEQQARFDALIAELRCPKCQNNNLADSNAPIAKDLRARTYELVREGRSDEEIVDYLKARYGDFITYKPPFNAVTALLWIGPFLLLLVAGGWLTLRVRRATRTTATAATADPARVRDILSRFATDATNDNASGPQDDSRGSRS
jgi:cytochrome c-type biogenesis protein CcmH